MLKNLFTTKLKGFNIGIANTKKHQYIGAPNIALLLRAL